MVEELATFVPPRCNRPALLRVTLPKSGCWPTLFFTRIAVSLSRLPGFLFALLDQGLTISLVPGAGSMDGYP